MRHARIFVFAAALSLSASCASISAGEAITGDASTDLRKSVDEIIDEHFVADFAPTLKGVDVTFQKEVTVPIIGKSVKGYYNPLPLMDHVTVEEKVAKQATTVVHELLHRVYFRNLWTWQCWAFWWDLHAVLADPEEKKFADRVRRRLNGRHWLNTLFAQTTEAYSDIGEDIISGAPVPARIRRHYKGILKKANRPPKEETLPASDTDASTVTTPSPDSSK